MLHNIIKHIFPMFSSHNVQNNTKAKRLKANLLFWSFPSLLSALWSCQLYKGIYVELWYKILQDYDHSFGMSILVTGLHYYFWNTIKWKRSTFWLYQHFTWQALKITSNPSFRNQSDYKETKICCAIPVCQLPKPNSSLYFTDE